MSFVVDAIERRSSASREHATAPVETSMTIALGALMAAGHGGSAACAEPAGASAATTAASTTATNGTGRRAITGGS